MSEHPRDTQNVRYSLTRKGWAAALGLPVAATVPPEGCPVTRCGLPLDGDDLCAMHAAQRERLRGALMPTGASVHYVSTGRDNLGLPMADGPYRHAHAPQRVRAKGLDFDALAPTCTGCGNRSGSVQYTSGLCATCRAPAPEPTALSLRNQDIAAAYRAGESLESLRRFGVGVVMLRRILGEQDVTLRPKGRPRIHAGRRPHRPTKPKPTPAAAAAATRKPGRQPVPVDEAAVVAEYQRGDTAVSVAARHGVLPKRIRTILDAHGVQRRDDRISNSGGGRAKPLSAYDPDLVQRLVEGYGAGLSTETLASEIGRSQRFVGIVLRKAGIELRIPASVRTEISTTDAAEIARRYATGEPAAQIARAFHIGTDRCHEIIIGQGVEMRRPGRRAAS